MRHFAEIPAVTSVAEAFPATTRFLEGWATDDPYLWFRGVKDCTLGLQPGACWRSGYSELGPLIDFVQDGVAFADVGNLEDWETYYLAQHHSIPTRLLDWTTSFGAALFFALDGWDGTTTPCVWVMKPHLMNKAFCSYEGLLTPENNKEYVDHWLPRPLAKAHKVVPGDEPGISFDNDWPLAIHPKRRGRRVVAQHGFFTIHGRQRLALPELLAARGVAPDTVLARLDLAKLDGDAARHQLSLLGIQRRTIYPDIDNFVRELRDEHGW